LLPNRPFLDQFNARLQTGQLAAIFDRL
jgi:hypothetical protein